MTEIPTDKQAALATSVFSQLMPAQLSQIARASDERHIAPGGVLCREGDFGQEAFVVARGELSVEIGDRRVDVAGPGRLVGEWAMLGAGRRTATLRALTATAVVVIDPDDVDALLAAVPSVAPAMGPAALTGTEAR